MTQRLDVFRLGRTPYAEALAVQRRLQADLVAARHDADGPAHALLVVEHDPVFTLGASGDTQNVLASEADLEARGAQFVWTDRGGDVTFHGPGQIVVYPILDLNRLEAPSGEPLRDLHRYLRALEEAVAETCASVGVVAGRVAGRTGVWVGPDARGAERKVCAMGIRCSRWVTMHGLALNVTTDLSWFRLIVPCGIADRGVTSLAREVSDLATREPSIDPAAVERTLVERVAHHVGAVPTIHVDGRAALAARLGEALPAAAV